MLIILRLAVLPHKHPHELLDSVVKERVVDHLPQPRRAFYSSLNLRQAISKISFQSQPLALSFSFKLHVSGRQILQRFKPLSTASFTASDHLDRTPSDLNTTT